MSVGLSPPSTVFHHRALYKWIHKRHHEWKKSMAINTEYAHPVEHLVSQRSASVHPPFSVPFSQLRQSGMRARQAIHPEPILSSSHAPHQIGNVLTTFGGPLLLGSHVLVFWAFLVFRLWETFDAHSGHTLPLLSPFSAIPWWTGPRMCVVWIKGVGLFGAKGGRRAWASFRAGSAGRCLTNVN